MFDCIVVLFQSVSEELHSLLEDRIKVSNNMAAAQMKLGSYEAALHSVETVLSCQPNNVKALFRKGKVSQLHKQTDSTH